jgi:16S rRNA processing protein RimM
MPSAYLQLGRAVRPWGLRGEVKVVPYTDSVAFAAGLQSIYLEVTGGDLARYEVERLRRTGSDWVMKLRGVDAPEEAKRLVGRELLIPRSSAPELPEGSYYHADLIGLRVRSEEGRELGRIVEIMETGANDVYVVRGQHGEWLLPATVEVVKGVDLEGEVVLVRPLEGMIEAEAI